jgi:tRNA1Val (adenine37-N6)-methyltransferase
LRGERETARSDGTADQLRAHGLRLIQPRHGYRFSLDPLLLCDFVTAQKAGRAIDLGTGCGVIPLVLARSRAELHAVGVEFQEELARLATQNVALNDLGHRVEIVEADILSLRQRFPASSFDLVTANPPYRKPGSGRVSPRAGRELARHESTAGLGDFLAVARYLVRPGGSICFISHPSRLAEFIHLAGGLRLALPRLRFVHGTPDAQATMFLAELVKGRHGSTVVLPPLLVRDGTGGYSAGLRRVLGE